MQLAFVPPAASPIRRQYLRLKEQHPDAILFFQLGDFYETFEDDARVVSSVCDVALTSREMGRGERLPMAGVPVHAADPYIARLVERGYHIAIAEQRADGQAATAAASSSGTLVPREVTRVITPGTLVESALLTPSKSNYLAAIVVGHQRIGLAYADISTGAFACTEIDGPDAPSIARGELARLRPAECLAEVTEPIAALLPADTPCTSDQMLFSRSGAERALCQHFHVSTIAALGLDRDGASAAAASAILRYVGRTQPRALASIERLRVYDARGFMLIDPATRDHLELIRGATGQRAGSLLESLDVTRTAMGARCLAQWIGHPLLELRAIEERLDLVQGLAELRELRAEVRNVLATVPDLERLAGRAAQRLLTPREALALASGLEGASALRAILRSETANAGALAPVTDRIDPPASVVDDVRSTVIDDPPSTFGEGVIRSGRIPELDELRSSAADGRHWLVELERRERMRTGLKNLKVGYNRVFGYYLEVSTSTLGQELDYYRRQETGARTVGELLESLGYQRRQTLASVERFVIAELREHEASQARSAARMAEIEREAMEALNARIAQEAARLQSTAVAIAELDALASLAQIADERRYVRPTILQEPVTEITAGRHPVVEQALGWDAYIPSDIRIGATGPDQSGGAEAPAVLLLTGPNMAGKTTFGRMVLLVTHMGQCGFFVPAESARLGLVDRIYLRSGAGDDIAGGRSTFMVEMTETAAILRSATRRSLIFFDEVGRGTSTYDGMAIARAIVEQLANPSHACRTIFSTHYHELAALEREDGVIQNVHTEVVESRDRIAFTYRVVPGSADRSYGVHVARLAGIPEPIIQRATEELERLEREGGATTRGNSAAGPCAPAIPPVVADLTELDIDHLSPIQALTALAQLRDRARSWVEASCPSPTNASGD